MTGETEIVLYNPDNSINIEVRFEEETVWLTQAQMALLFDTTPQNVTMHIRGIYGDEELLENLTCKDFLQVRQECTISFFERVGKMLFMATVANFATVQNEGGRNLI